jgi:hypothetical protein
MAALFPVSTAQTPYKPKTSLKQALSMEHGSSILFDMTLVNFEGLNKPLQAG